MLAESGVMWGATAMACVKNGCEERNRGVGRECWGEVLGWISNKWLYTYTIDLHSQICTVHDAPCWPKCMLDNAYIYKCFFEGYMQVFKRSGYKDLGDHFTSCLRVYFDIFCPILSKYFIIVSEARRKKTL